jgi:hypothetical protein
VQAKLRRNSHENAAQWNVGITRSELGKFVSV